MTQDYCGENSGSACMTVNASIAAYRTAMNPFAGQALIGAPAVTNDGAPSGLTYLGNFLAGCPDCHVDFVNVRTQSANQI